MGVCLGSHLPGWWRTLCTNESYIAQISKHPPDPRLDSSKMHRQEYQPSTALQDPGMNAFCRAHVRCEGTSAQELL